ncbi:MAG: CAP domain-containing protein [Clostridiales bacterium]|nr:CAP domain-containing protein [Clostridiales bacterium]
MNIRKLGGLILLVALLGAYSASAESAVCYNADARTVSWTQDSCAPGRVLLTARQKGVTVWSAVCDASLGCYALPDSLRGEITLCVARIGSRKTSCVTLNITRGAEQTPVVSAAPTAIPTRVVSAVPTAAPTATPRPTAAPSASQSGMAAQVVAEVNAERAQRSLTLLSEDSDLTAAACIRAREIASVFSHTRPDGSSCFTVSEKAYGENIAKGYGTVDKVMAAWMSSEGHRANILRASYGSIGVCCLQIDGVYYWVQLFGK